MPKISKPTKNGTPRADETPVEKLTRFHRLDLHREPTGGGWYSECLFCGSDKNLKWKDNTQYHCWSCDERGNDSTLIRHLYATSPTDHDLCVQLAEDAGCNEPETLAMTMADWAGVRRHLITGEACLPGYNAEGQITGLYVWRNIKTKEGRWKPTLMASPGLGSHLLGLGYELEQDPDQFDNVFIVEGWRDGAVLRWAEDKYSDNPSAVIAITGVNGFKPSWCELLTASNVYLMLDNDHPRVNKHNPDGPLLPGAGPAGVKRLGGLLLSKGLPPDRLYYLDWSGTGDPGIYHPDVENKADLRDVLTGTATLA